MTNVILIICIIWLFVLSGLSVYGIYLLKQSLSPCMGDIVKRVVNDPTTILHQQKAQEAYVKFTNEMIAALNANTKTLDQQHEALKKFLERLNELIPRENQTERSEV